MKSKILKASGILISLGSALFAIYWIWAFASSTSPDRALFIAPLFFCGLPLTVAGHIVGFGFMIAGKGLWYDALPIIICYLFQWQFIGRWLYRKGVCVQKP
jgi:hypothetical protein